MAERTASWGIVHAPGKVSGGNSVAPITRESQDRRRKPSAVGEPDYADNSNGDSAQHFPDQRPQRSVPDSRGSDLPRCPGDIELKHRYQCGVFQDIVEWRAGLQ